LARAHENHEKNDATKEHMREARKDVIKKNNDVVGTERQKKLERSMMKTDSKDASAAANRAVRDSVFMAKFVDEEKAKLMSSPDWKAAAEVSGVALPLEMSGGPSPYKLG